MVRVLGLLVLIAVGYLLLHNRAPAAADLNQPVRVAEILSAPQRYENRLVVVHGIVTGGIGFVGIGGFRVRDPDGGQEIFVVSAAGVPAAGATVTITGTFHVAATVGSHQVPVIVVTS